MRFITRHNPDQTPKGLGELTPEERESLREYWILSPDDRPNSLLMNVGRILAKAQKLDAWIECDCKVNKDGNKEGEIVKHPIIAAVQYKTNHYKIQRLSMRGDHHDRCPFHWEEGELGKRRNNKPHEQSPSLLPNDPDFIILSDGEGKAATGKSSVSVIRKGHQGKRKDGLQQLLFWLLSQSGLNVLDGTSLLRKDRLEKFQEVIRLKPIARNLPVPIMLSEVTWWTTEAIEKNWIKSRFQKLHKTWPKNLPLQGFLFLRIASVDTANNTVADHFGNTVKIDGKLSVYSNSNMEVITGQQIGLITIIEENGQLTFPRAYVHPIRLDWINKDTNEKYTDFFPVDSDYERSAANVLIKFVRLINSKEDKDSPPRLRITKPLEDFDVSGIGCRPDFIIEDRITGRTAVIETMGSTDEEYLERKAGTHKLMATLGTLLLDERNRHDRNQADKILEEQLFQWFKGALRGQ